MQCSIHVCASKPILFFLFPRAVLPLSCITHSAPVWLSLAGWWSFLADCENPSEFLAPISLPPLFPTRTHSRTHTPTHTYTITKLTLLLFFPDCNASVHKGCRDSMPVCANVKMKVKLFVPCRFSSTDPVAFCCPAAKINFFLFPFVSMLLFPRFSV